MRSVKFRGIRKDNGEWILGYYMTSGKEHHLGERHYIVCGDNPSLYAGREFIEVIPESVGQFTGLVDRNGAEIYCDDIVTSNCTNFLQYDRATVIYSNGSTHLELPNRTWVMNWNSDDIEVIGSIHTTPELLKQKV